METNNLTELLTAVAAAIRERDGTDELISPQDFAERILTLSNEYVDGELKLIYGETEPGSVLGGTWVEDDFPYGTFLMAAGSGGTAGQSSGSNTHSHEVTLRYHAFWNNFSGNDQDMVTLKDSTNPDTPYVPNTRLEELATFRTNAGLQNNFRNEEEIVSYESTGRTAVADNRPMNRTVHVWRKVA